MRGAKIPKKGEQEMKGVITEIERFSLKDGPGIRTTVFFKGCNMACSWCHNPETLSVKPQLMVYPKNCIGCGACLKTGKCFREDGVNEFVEKAKTADGFVFGSPVHYASASGMITSFLDRAFYGKSALFQGKPGACVVSCRRGGASAAFDQLNKYFTINCMPVVSSQYWNQVHGNTPEEVKQDLEGMQTMRTLGNNMAWLLKCIEAGKAAGVSFPEREPAQKTNFIR